MRLYCFNDEEDDDIRVRITSSLEADCLGSIPAPTLVVPPHLLFSITLF